MFLEGLDELDQKIVQLLIQNARMSYSELGEKTGISRVAVKMRVQALEQRGVIEQYTAIVNPQKLSGAVSCYFELETAPGMLAGVAEMVARTAVAIVLVPILGYFGAELSNPAAWIAACLFLYPAYRWTCRQLDNRLLTARLHIQGDHAETVL